MKPEKMSVLEVFQRERRLCVPLFQRAYVWNLEQQWRPLWEDVVRQADAHLRSGDDQSIHTHFLGAVVINLANVQGRSVARADIIDGQQRLTTMQLLLAALRDVAAEVGADPEDVDVFTRHTANPVRDKESAEVLKVWPTNSDREHFSATMRAGSLGALIEKFGDPADMPRIPAAYAFFHTAISECVAEDQEPEARRDRVFALRQALQSTLQLVVIELEPGDDSQMIFETLNARGQPLLPSDLIRNFVFMKAATRSEQESERLYASYWSPFDETLIVEAKGERRFWHREERQGREYRPRIDHFMYHYLTMKTERDIRIGQLFEEFRSWWSSETRVVEVFLADLRRYASLYVTIAVPSGHDRMSVLASRLSSLDTSTVHPLMLFLAGLNQTALPDEHRGRIAQDIESYLVRRFVSGLTPKNYNRFFLGLLTKTKAAARAHTDIHEAIRVELQRSDELTSLWPDDATFLKGWLGTPIYVASRSDRAAMLLRAVNAEMGTKRNETVSIGDVTVEHLMPQRGTVADYPYAPLTTDDVDATPELRRRRLMNTVGNLTLLTGPLNTSISNGPFEAKKPAIVADSDLRINAWLRTDPRTTWDEADIVERGRGIFAEAARIWPRPEAAAAEPD